TRQRIQAQRREGLVQLYSGQLRQQLLVAQSRSQQELAASRTAVREYSDSAKIAAPVLRGGFCSRRGNQGRYRNSQGEQRCMPRGQVRQLSSPAIRFRGDCKRLAGARAAAGD